MTQATTTPAALERDGSGHLFAEVENLRITYIPASDRTEDQNWAGSDVIRIQAYKGTGKAMFMGAEFPVSSAEAMVGLVAAVCRVYTEGRALQP